MADGDVAPAQQAPQRAPEGPAHTDTTRARSEASTHPDAAREKTDAETRLRMDAGLAAPKTTGGSDTAQAGTDAAKTDDKKTERHSPFREVFDHMYGPRAIAAAQKQDLPKGDLTFPAIPGYDAKVNDGRTEPGAKKVLPNGATELAHGPESQIVKEKSGAITDQGDLNGQHYEATASKDKDSITWKDKDGKEHHFERKKGANSNEYTDGDGTRLVQNGDKNDIYFNNGYHVTVDARTGRSSISDQQGEVAQYNGKDAVKRQIDDNNVAYQVRGDVGNTIQQIRDYQKRSGETQHGNIIVKNEKGDTVVLQDDGTEISRNADSTTVTIKKGDTSVTYTPGQKPVVSGGEGHVTEQNGGLQIDGKEMVNPDGTVIISGLQNGKLDSTHGRIYGTTGRGGQVDLGAGRAIADDLTTQNTGTGVKAIGPDNKVILDAAPDGKHITTGPITTNVDQTHPTTTIDGGNGIHINIDNGTGASQTTDAYGAVVAGIDQAGNMDTWDCTHFGADGDIWNYDLGLDGWTSFDPNGASSFISTAADDDSYYGSYGDRYSTSVAQTSDNYVSVANSVYSDATSLANGVDANPGTLGMIDTNIGSLLSIRSQVQAMLPFNPKLYDQIGAIDNAWSQLSSIRPVVQNQVTAQELLRSHYGVTTKDAVARSASMGSTPSAVDKVAEMYNLYQTA